MVLLLFFFIVVFISYFDKRVFGTWFTPSIVLSIPYLCVIALNFISGEWIGLNRLEFSSIWYWFFGLLSFWLPGLLIGVLLYKRTGSVSDILLPENGKNIRFFFRMISVIFLIPMLISLHKVLSFYEYNSEEANELLGGGIAAHANMWLRISVVYFISVSRFKKKDIFNWIIVLLWLFFSFVYNVKVWILIPLIGGIIGRLIYYNKFISFTNVIYVILLGFSVFYISYSLSFGLLAPWDFIIKQFIYYSNAGLLSFSEYVKQNMSFGISMEFLYQPIYNVFYKLTNQDLHPIISKLNLHLGSNYYSNVKTFFGSIYIYGGIIGGTFTSFIWGATSYFFLVLTNVTKNWIITSLYLIIIAALFLGFFDIYFNTLSYYENIIIAFALVLIHSFLFNNKKLKFRKKI